MDLGASYLALGQVEASGAALRRALAVDPDHAMGHLQLARWFAYQSDFAAAEQAAKEALKQAPSLVAAQVLLGTLLARKGEMAQALHHFENALALGQSQAQNHNNNVATAHFQLGNLERARDHYLEAVALDLSLIHI